MFMVGIEFSLRKPGSPHKDVMVLVREVWLSYCRQATEPLERTKEQFHFHGLLWA